MVTQIPLGDPGVAAFTSEEHGQIEVWSGKPPSLSTTENLDGVDTFSLYQVVGFDEDGNLAPATYGGAAKASGALTFSGLALADETVVIDGVTYTFKAALTPAAGEVLIGADAAGCASNLTDAINGNVANADTTYGAGNGAHSSVVATLNGAVVELQAENPGQAGEVATTETLTNGAFGAATLTGGIGGVQAVGIMTRKVTAGESKAAIWRDGVWNPNALVWHASFDTAEKKRMAFYGAPAPTQIVIQANPYDPTFS